MLKNFIIIFQNLNVENYTYYEKIFKLNFKFTDFIT